MSDAALIDDQAWLHADDDCVVAVKPSGLLSVPGRSVADCHWRRLASTFPDLRIVHRLDMATSGLIVYARGAEAQRRLGSAFAGRAVDKAYTAVVDGRVDEDAGEIDLPILADWPNRPRQKVDLLNGKPASTRYRVLARDRPAGTTRLSLALLTGRSHQLRVHLLAIAHPIVGDTLYAPPSVAAGADRLLLHATTLRFAHPRTGAPLLFESQPPF